MRKVIEVSELPKGFIYLTATHRVVGIGERNVLKQEEADQNK
jgi:hypothetical protein